MNAHDTHPSDDAHSSPGVVGNPRTPPASSVSAPTDHPLAECPLAHDTHASIDAHLGNSVVGNPCTPPPAVRHSTPTLGTRVEEYELRNRHITFLAETLNDLEDLRKATGNRVWQIENGDYVGIETTLAAVATGLEDALQDVEDGIVKQLEKAMLAHPLGPWLKHPDRRGVGAKQGARLLAAIGNPYWNARDDRPRRGPAELWAYCGFHVLPASLGTTETHTCSAGGQLLAGTDQPPTGNQSSAVGAGQSLHPSDQSEYEYHTTPVAGVAPRRRKGAHANWNAQARSRAWLIANSCLKQPVGTRYRDVYIDGRAKYADAVHTSCCERCTACTTCGNAASKNKTEHLAEHGCDNRRLSVAGPGSPLSPAHQHARALRLIAKEVLKDIYVEAKAWHENEEETA